MVTNHDGSRKSHYRLDVHRAGTTFDEALAEDTRAGLTGNVKSLPPKYFYDAEGSALFDRITTLPEYYLTRTEKAIMTGYAPALMAEIQPAELLELGAGTCAKIRWLMNARNGASSSRLRFLPFDVDEKTVADAVPGLLEDYSFLDVHGVIGDFQGDLHHIPPPRGRRLAVFFGSTIGNLHADERLSLLTDLASILGRGDYFLLGVDLVKDTKTLEAAYNDSAGVTAAFNRNILRVLNRHLGSDFDPTAYAHHAYFNQAASRIEMHLRPSTQQRVSITALGIDITITPNETIWTESSYKFTRDGVSEMLSRAGLPLVDWRTDPHNMFALALAQKA